MMLEEDDIVSAWTKGTTEFDCPNCGARYSANYQDFPVRDKGSFNCSKCNHEVHRWNGTRDYTGWTLIEDA